MSWSTLHFAHSNLRFRTNHLWKNINVRENTTPSLSAHTNTHRGHMKDTPLWPLEKCSSLWSELFLLHDAVQRAVVPTAGKILTVRAMARTLSFHSSWPIAGLDRCLLLNVAMLCWPTSHRGVTTVLLWCEPFRLLRASVCLLTL